MNGLIQRRRASLRDDGDGGAALIVVLIIITVIAMMAGALMSFTDSSVRTTLALRDQAAQAYDADGAAQVAVDQLRRGTFNGGSGNCLGAGTSTLLSNIYPATNGVAASSAFVTCSPDPSNGSGGGATSPNTSPGSAVLTLGTGTGGEDGIYVSSNAGAVKVYGGVFSNSTINANAGGIQNIYDPTKGTPYTIARGNCVNQANLTPAQYVQCNYATADTRGTDPGLLTPHGASYDPPPVATANATISACSGGATYQTVTPGRFTAATALNSLTGCTTHVVYFTPGRYYFNFTSGTTHIWTVQNVYVIAGTPTIPLTTTPTPAQMPTSCVPPASASATTSSGAEFIFGGDSQFLLSHQGSPGGQLAICASASANGPPVAIYGLKTALGGSFPVSAQSGCITTLPPSSPRCDLVTTDQSPNTTLTIQGLTYATKATANIALNNSTNQVFRWGLILRALKISATGSPDLSNAMIDVPDVATSPTPTSSLVYLNVYTCAGSSTCSTSTGVLGLRAKVLLSPTSPKTVTTLSWSIIR